MYAHLDKHPAEPARWRLRHLLVFLAVLAAVIAASGWMHGAWATDADVSYSTVCANPQTGQWDATVTVRSRWDGGTIHVHVEQSSSGGINFDVPPLGTNSGTIHRQYLPEQFAVIVSSPDGHLHGELTHTFTRPDGCTPVATTIQRLPACPPGQHFEIPGGGGCFPDITIPPEPPPAAPTPTTGVCTPQPSTGPGTVVCEPPTSVSVPTAPPSSASGGGGGRPTTSAALRLPVTGMSTYAVLWIGAAVFVIGLILIGVSRSQARRRQLDEWGRR